MSDGETRVVENGGYGMCFSVTNPCVGDFVRDDEPQKEGADDMVVGVVCRNGFCKLQGCGDEWRVRDCDSAEGLGRQVDFGVVGGHSLCSFSYIDRLFTRSDCLGLPWLEIACYATLTAEPECRYRGCWRCAQA